LTVAGLLIPNIVVVWYLFADRFRLFGHDHPAVQRAFRTAATNSQEN
jgi:hypothetical protein